MSFVRGLVALAACLVLLVPATAVAGNKEKKAAAAKSGVTCNLPESNAEALVILNNYYPGYWWDHTDLTIAVKHTRVRPVNNSPRSTTRSRPGRRRSRSASTA